MSDCENKDLLRPIGFSSDGEVVVQRHRPGHTTELVTVASAVEGQPLVAGQEIATTRARGDGTVEIVDSYVHGTAARGKPVQVATPDYRNGWDRTFNSRGGSA